MYINKMNQPVSSSRFSVRRRLSCRNPFYWHLRKLQAKRKSQTYDFTKVSYVLYQREYISLQYDSTRIYYGCRHVNALNTPDSWMTEGKGFSTINSNIKTFHEDVESIDKHFEGILHQVIIKSRVINKHLKSFYKNIQSRCSNCT